jgi:hypothetical protein
MLETAAEIADSASELRLDPITAAARRRGVVGLVENQKAPRQQRAEPLPHRIGVGRIAQQVVRDEKPAVRPPRVDREATLATHPRDVVAIEDLEDKTEALVQLRLPLLEHRRRRRDNDRLGLLTQQQLARDQAGLDRLTETSIVGDEEVGARQPKRLAQRLHLVGVDLDARPEGRLEQVRVSRRDGVPPQRVEERREVPRIVKAPRRQVVPALVYKNPPVELVVPKHVEKVALGVVVRARQAHDRRAAVGVYDLFDQPSPRTDLDQLAGLRDALGQRFGPPRVGHPHADSVPPLARRWLKEPVLLKISSGWESQSTPDESLPSSMP